MDAATTPPFATKAAASFSLMVGPALYMMHCCNASLDATSMGNWFKNWSNWGQGLFVEAIFLHVNDALHGEETQAPLRDPPYSHSTHPASQKWVHFPDPSGRGGNSILSSEEPLAPFIFSFFFPSVLFSLHKEHIFSAPHDLDELWCCSGDNVWRSGITRQPVL